MTTTEGHVADRPVEVFRGPDGLPLFMTNVPGVGRGRHLRRARTDRRIASSWSATRCDPGARHIAVMPLRSEESGSRGRVQRPV